MTTTAWKAELPTSHSAQAVARFFSSFGVTAAPPSTVSTRPLGVGSLGEGAPSSARPGSAMRGFYAREAARRRTGEWAACELR
ncbi:hypothetical protein ACFPRL_17960 [Pseudoclavibacter helvolus]